MADALNSNIFEGAAGAFTDALPLFSGVASAALPVRLHASGPVPLHTLADMKEEGQPALAAFTSESLLTPPFVRQPLREAALLFFHAPFHELFIFNPASHPQARPPCAALKGSRLQVSLLAGFLGTGPAADSSSADEALSAGRLHEAHYLYAKLHARNPASRARFQMCSAMLELGLLQEAYDLLKSDNDPEARLLLASIHRRTGSTAEAAAILSGLAGESRYEERRTLETAWLDLEEGRYEKARNGFQRLSASAFDKTEPLFGLGSALARAAFTAKDRSMLPAAVTALRSALISPSPFSGRILFQLGNLYLRSGDAAQAEACYRSSAGLTPSVQSLANLALALLREGRHEEAAAVTAKVALTDPASAVRLASEFPKEKAAALFPRAGQEPPPAPSRPAPEAPAPRPPQAARPAPQPAPAPSEKPAQPEPSRPGLDAMSAGFKFITPAPEPPRPAAEQVSLAPAQPRDASFPGGRPAPAQEAAPAPELPRPMQIETLRDVMAGAAVPTEEESRRDDFISRAFRLASDLEDELGRKIYFNISGLNEVERKLRLRFIKDRDNPQGNIETVRDCAAFLCYFLQERHKGRLLKLTDFDPWGWPMVFELPDRKLTTYPIVRVWRLLWEETVPEPGWLSKYADWVGDRLKEPVLPQGGAQAVRAKVMSHQERLTDAQTEHRRIMVLVSSLSETSHIELSRTGLAKIEKAVKNNFRPGIPPTADGWKLLRCYGHILAALLAKDLKAAWYNADGEDGGWSMRLPWGTFVFPLGKIYKTAANSGDLGAYYDALAAEKLRLHGPGGA